MAETVAINVSGRSFVVERGILTRFPKSTLGRLVASNTEQREFVFQRPTAVFKCVLTYHQTGHLHIPQSVCLGLFESELEFWGFKTDELEPCCRRKLKKFQQEQEDFLGFEKSLTENTIHECGCCPLPDSCITRRRQFIWSILDEPLSSKCAKVYFALSSLVIILSIIILFLGTLEEFKGHMSSENWAEYLGDAYEENKDKIRILSGNNVELHDSNRTRAEIIGNFTLPDHVFVENKTFVRIQIFCTVFFVLELLLKFLCCPHILCFFKSPLNVIDVLAVIVSLLDLVAEYVSPGQRYTSTFVDAIAALQVVRALRLLRLTKYVTGARVLAYAVTRSYKELCFMSLLLAINTIIFGTLAHSVNKEKMKDLPLASWWALITMTTVGYGDVVPSNHAGKFIGVVCACMGVMVLALTMPLFVDNFLTFYAYGQEICKKKTSERLEKAVKRKEIKQDPGVNGYPGGDHNVNVQREC